MDEKSPDERGVDAAEEGTVSVSTCDSTVSTILVHLLPAGVSMSVSTQEEDSSSINAPENLEEEAVGSEGRCLDRARFGNADDAIGVGNFRGGRGSLLRCLLADILSLLSRILSTGMNRAFHTWSVSLVIPDLIVARLLFFWAVGELFALLGRPLGLAIVIRLV